MDTIKDLLNSKSPDDKKFGKMLFVSGVIALLADHPKMGVYQACNYGLNTEKEYEYISVYSGNYNNFSYVRSVNLLIASAKQDVNVAVELIAKDF